MHLSSGAKESQNAFPSLVLATETSHASTEKETCIQMLENNR